MFKIQTSVIAFARLIINLLLATIVSYQLTFLLLKGQTLPSLANYQTVDTAPLANAKNTLDISPLLQAHLFGKKVKSSNVSTRATNEPLPETKLDLTLRGIYYSSHPTDSFAMIVRANNQQVQCNPNNMLCKIGEFVQPGVKLEAIYQDYIVLLRNGRHESLALVGGTGANHLIQHEITPQKNNQLAPEVLLANYQQQLKTNPESLFSLAKITPASENGQFIGYQIDAGRDPDLLEKFRLQPNDIITNVNGVALDSPLKGISVVQQLASAKQISLTIQRYGQPVSLSFNLDK